MLTVYEIAIRNFIGNNFGVSDPNIISSMLGTLPVHERLQFEGLIGQMLTGPAGDLAENCGCEAMEGYVQALTEVRDQTRLDDGFTGRDREIAQSVLDQIKAGITTRIEQVTAADQAEEADDETVVVPIAVLLAQLFGRGGVSPTR